MRRGDYDEFHESLATPYAERDTAYWSVGNIVSAIAGVLDVLLLIRFVTHLVSSDTTLGFVALVDGLTNWLAVPFGALLGFTTATTATGYVDWAALVAVIVVSVIAAVVNRAIRAARV